MFENTHTVFFIFTADGQNKKVLHVLSLAGLISPNIYIESETKPSMTSNHVSFALVATIVAVVVVHKDVAAVVVVIVVGVVVIVGDDDVAVVIMVVDL